MTSRGFRDLQVWQRSMELVRSVYGVCAQLPKHEMYALSDQLRRSAVSVPSNITEGQKRNGGKEFIHFLGVAQGSLAEVETQLVLVTDLYTIDTSLQVEECQAIGKMLSGLLRSLKTDNSTPTTRAELG